MLHQRLKLSILLMLVLQITGIYAQESVNSSGGKALGSAGVVDYSIGQVAFDTNNGTSGALLQGVQQPFDIVTITSIVEYQGIDISVYPNPASDILKLNISNASISNFKINIYDINGSLVQNERITAELTHINMKRFKADTYFFKITDGNKLIKTFKIIKK